MALSAKLQMRQSQALVMTPQLMQSIRLLQFTHIELERFIDDEIEKNPLLERQEPQDEHGLAEPQDYPEIAPEVLSPLDQLIDMPDASSETISGALDASLENVFPDDPGVSEHLSPDLAAQWKTTSNGTATGEGFGIEDFAAVLPSLSEHVNEQIAFIFREAAARLIARELADALDETGYMRADPAEIADRLGADEGEMLAVLATCQTFDPPGLFARDLAECLAIQLRARDRFDPAMQSMIANLDLLARRD